MPKSRIGPNFSIENIGEKQAVLLLRKGHICYLTLCKTQGYLRTLRKGSRDTRCFVISSRSSFSYISSSQAKETWWMHAAVHCKCFVLPNLTYPIYVSAFNSITAIGTSSVGYFFCCCSFKVVDQTQSQLAAEATIQLLNTYEKSCAQHRIACRVQLHLVASSGDAGLACFPLPLLFALSISGYLWQHHKKQQPL